MSERRPTVASLAQKMEALQNVIEELLCENRHRKTEVLQIKHQLDDAQKKWAEESVKSHLQLQEEVARTQTELDQKCLHRIEKSDEDLARIERNLRSTHSQLEQFQIKVNAALDKTVDESEYRAGVDRLGARLDDHTRKINRLVSELDHLRGEVEGISSQMVKEFERVWHENETLYVMAYRPTLRERLDDLYWRIRLRFGRKEVGDESNV